MPPPAIPLMVLVYRGLAITLLITRVIVIWGNWRDMRERKKMRQTLKRKSDYE